jgi:hypothetical protein
VGAGVAQPVTASANSTIAARTRIPMGRPRPCRQFDHLFFDSGPDTHVVSHSGQSRAVFTRQVTVRQGHASPRCLHGCSHTVQESHARTFPCSARAPCCPSERPRLPPTSKRPRHGCFLRTGLCRRALFRLV